MTPQTKEKTPLMSTSEESPDSKTAQESPSGKQQLDRMKRAFTEVVSHELNTPVAIILGYTSLLSRHFNDSETAQEFDTVTERALRGMEVAARRLESISDRIFKILSDEGPASSLQLTEIDVCEFLDGAHEQIAGFLEERGQSLSIQVNDKMPSSFQGDREKLEDALVNLLMNAIKFSRDGQEIQLTANLQEAESIEGDSTGNIDTGNIDGLIEFIVEDRGVGIDPEDIDQVFDAFFSTMRSRHHSSGEFGFEKRGIGLGLPVARQFVQMHDGDIDVESEPGEGSRFTIKLPLKSGA